MIVAMDHLREVTKMIFRDGRKNGADISCIFRRSW